ncbi:diacylglycerol O-acyltransferase 1, variant 2 [Entomophthora muscae]|nr:diacylglycerol O-acyltransferase 1, variant 2 [Entomophthora muscae]
MFLNLNHQDKNKKKIPFGLGKVINANKGQPSSRPPPTIVNKVSDSDDESPRDTPSVASDDENDAPSAPASEIAAPVNVAKAASHAVPEVRAPVYKAPSHAVPEVHAPVHNAPSHAVPAAHAPVHKAPSHAVPAAHAPVYKAPSHAVPEVRAPVYEAPVYEAPQAYSKPKEPESLEGFIDGLSVHETPGIFHGNRLPSPNLPSMVLKAGSLHKLPDLVPFEKTRDGLFKKPKNIPQSQLSNAKPPSLEKIFTEHAPKVPESFREPESDNSSSTSLIYKLTGSKEATPSKDSYGSILDALKPKAIKKAVITPAKQLAEDTISLCGEELDDSKGIREIAKEMIPTSFKQTASDLLDSSPVSRDVDEESNSEPSSPLQQYFAHFLVIAMPIVSRIVSTCCYMSPLLWPLGITYSLFLVYDQAHKKGFRSSTAQSWSLGKAFAEYFPTSLQTLTTLDPNHKYIFLYHNEDNSDSSLTAFAAFTAQPTLSQNIYFMAPQEEFSSPLYREILYSSKMATNNNATIARILEEGHSCLIPTTDDPSAIDPDLLELACISG